MQQLNSVNKKNLQKQAEDLANQKNLHFDKNETEKLLIKFTELTQNNKRPFLDRNQFRFVFWIFSSLINIFFWIVIYCTSTFAWRKKSSWTEFSARSTPTPTRSFQWRTGLLDSRSFCEDLSRKKPTVRATKKIVLQQKCSDSFRVYDLNGDGFISREEMFQLLKNCLVKQPAEEDPDEGVKELVEITLKKMVKCL